MEGKLDPDGVPDVEKLKAELASEREEIVEKLAEGQIVEQTGRLDQRVVTSHGAAVEALQEVLETLDTVDRDTQVWILEAARTRFNFPPGLIR